MTTNRKLVKSLRHFETFVACIKYELPLIHMSFEVCTGPFSCAYSLKTLNDHSFYGRGFGISRFLKIVDVRFFYCKNAPSLVPVYHNYKSISWHCARNVLSAVAIDASLNFNNL